MIDQTDAREDIGSAERVTAELPQFTIDTPKHNILTKVSVFNPLGKPGFLVKAPQTLGVSSFPVCYAKEDEKFVAYVGKLPIWKAETTVEVRTYHEGQVESPYKNSEEDNRNNGWTSSEEYLQSVYYLSIKKEIQGIDQQELFDEVCRKQSERLSKLSLEQAAEEIYLAGFDQAMEFARDGDWRNAGALASAIHNADNYLLTFPHMNSETVNALFENITNIPTNLLATKLGSNAISRLKRSSYTLGQTIQFRILSSAINTAAKMSETSDTVSQNLRTAQALLLGEIKANEDALSEATGTPISGIISEVYGFKK